MRSALTDTAASFASRMKGLILDVGSGDDSQFHALMQGDVVSLEVTRDSFAAQTDPRIRHKVLGSAHALPFKGGAFDSVWCHAVVEHVAADTVPELLRVLRGGGEAAILTPNRRSPTDVYNRLAGKPTWWESGYVDGVAPAFPHVRLYSVGELARLGRRHGRWARVWGVGDSWFPLRYWINRLVPDRWLSALLHRNPRLAHTILLHVEK